MVLISVLIVSCSDLTLATDPLVIETIDDGQTLSVGDDFSISINKSNSSSDINPTTATVQIIYKNNLRDINDEDVQPLFFDVDLLETPEPSFEITSDLKEGVYDLLVYIYDGDTIISEKKSEFIIFSGNLSASASSISPVKGLYTESVAILKSNIDYINYIDPYLIWRYKDSILYQGYLSEGADSILWSSGAFPGFYTVRLDIFPYKLKSSLILSGNYVEFPVLVNPLSSNLYPDIEFQEYSHLLLFNGNYIDEKNKDIIATISDSRVPRILNGFYGMEFMDNRGFSVNRSLMAKDEESGEYKNFSIILDYKVVRNDNGYLLRNRDGEFGFDYYIDDGVLRNRFFWGSSILADFDITPVVIDSTSRFTVSYISNETGFDLLYYSNGSLVKIYKLILTDEQLNTSLSNIGHYTVGGTPDSLSCSVILDTLKVYTTSSNGGSDIYPDNLLDSLGSSQNKDIIYATGFNTLSLPNEFVGSGSIDGEILSMDKDSSLVYENLLEKQSSYSIFLDVVGTNPYLISFFNNDSYISKTISGNLEISRNEDSVLINGEVFLGWEASLVGLKIEPEESLQLDSLVVLSVDRVIEEHP